MKIRALKAAFPLTLHVMAGYLVLGAGFGILLQSKGYSFVWAILMSLTIYAGSMQFVAVSLLTSGATLITAALMTLMINARHLFYGLSMLDKYKHMGRKKGLLIFELTDETYALACSAQPPAGIDPGWFYLGLSVLNQSYWIIGSALGALLGTFIPFNTTGIDFAMTALFVVIFIEQWLTSKRHLPALIGLFAALACLLAFGPDRFVIPAMLAIALILTIFRQPLEKEGERRDDA